MKKNYLLFIALFIFGCAATSQFLTYNVNGKKWNIDIKHNRFTQNFKVFINDSLVIDDAANFLFGDFVSKGKYDDKEVKLIVSYKRDLLTNQEIYEAMIFVENELIGKLRL